MARLNGWDKTERMAWFRVANQMAVLVNINTPKNKKRVTADDFLPWKIQKQSTGVPSPELVERLVKLGKRNRT